MNNIIETNFGKKVDISRMANGSASNITKQGTFITRTFVLVIRFKPQFIRDN